MDAISALPRPDIAASHFSLRVSKRAWKDLDFRTGSERLDMDAIARHDLLQKFADHCRRPENIDRGEPIRQVRHPRVFRIKVNNWRGAVWFDHDAAVLWLLRALPLSKFHEEADLYVQFGELERREQLLPSSEELMIAKGEQYITSVIMALGEAVREAYAEQGVWQPALSVRPNGDPVPAGRVHVVTDEMIVTQHVILREAAFRRKDLIIPLDWRELVMATIFPPDEPVMRAVNGLPDRAELQDGEIPLVQVRAEDEPLEWMTTL